MAEPADLITALVAAYDATGGIPGLQRAWNGAVPDYAVLPYAVFSIRSSYRQFSGAVSAGRSAFHVGIAAEVYVEDDPSAAVELGEALAALVESGPLRWAGGGCSRPWSAGEPTLRRDLHRARKGHELWVARHLFDTMAIEERG